LQFKAIGQIPWDIYQYDLRIFNVLGQQILIKKGYVTYFSNVDFELSIDWSEEELVKLIGESVFNLELLPSKNNETILISGKITTLK
jgi:hypothetical protein